MNLQDHNDLMLLAIAGAALATYALRIGGLLLADRLPHTGAFKTFLEALPGTILISIVMPGIMAAGIWGWIAAAMTALLARKTGNTFVAMLAGVAVVALSRFLTV
ncbi:MAG: AzlD domain-containing protein [Desulfobacterales bacterium]|nr:AzlD domain-containing protein [Desulfobacterales bacterium]